MKTFKLLMNAVAFASALLLVSCSSAPQTPQEFNYDSDLSGLGVTQDRIDTLDSLLQSFVSEKKMPFVTAFCQRWKCRI